jgi:hypothetical protein
MGCSANATSLASLEAILGSLVGLNDFMVIVVAAILVESGVTVLFLAILFCWSSHYVIAAWLWS